MDRQARSELRCFELREKTIIEAVLGLVIMTIMPLVTLSNAVYTRMVFSPIKCFSEKGELKFKAQDT
jgi:hypothetical protein